MNLENPQAPGDRNLIVLSQFVARSLVFLASAAILVVEILAVRLLAPYLGVSLEVFTGVIGVILAGIAVGAWVGGRAADRSDPRRLLGPLLAGGGLATVVSPLLVDAVGPGVSSDAISIVFVTAVGFFIPAALLSAVPPVVVKIRLSTLARTGTVVGSYSAIGTAGALFGTFVTGFVLIAAFPTRPIMITVGAVLVLIGLLVWGARGAGTTVGIVLALVGFSALLVIGEQPCQYETTYHCAIVTVDESRPSGRLLILDRLSNSYVDLTDPTHLEFRYARTMADIINVEAPPTPLRMVSIGGGGFTMPGWLEATRPGSSNTVLEIDSSLVEIGKVELALRDTTEVILDDARISLLTIDPASADVIIGDAFSGRAVPWHLTTVEYTEQISATLTTDGIYTMNLIDFGELRFVRSAGATLFSVFDNVALFARPEGLAGQGGNYVFVASRSPIDTGAIVAAVRARGGREVVLTGDDLRVFIGDANVLTDDFAPVDQMIGRR